MPKKHEDRPGYTLKFVRWITNPKTGQIVYPKTGKVFPIWVKT